MQTKIGNMISGAWRTLILIVLLTPVSTLNAQQDYWVLGSFKSVVQATVEQRRLQGLLGIEVIVMQVPHLGVFRVAVEQNDVDQGTLDQADISHWALSLDGTNANEVAVEPAKTRTVSGEKVYRLHETVPGGSSDMLHDTVSSQRSEFQEAASSQATMKHSPALLLPGESFRDYCMRHSRQTDSPRHCDADRLRAVEDRQVELTRHRQELNSFCERSTQDKAFKAICDAWFNQRSRVD